MAVRQPRATLGARIRRAGLSGIQRWASQKLKNVFTLVHRTAAVRSANFHEARHAIKWIGVISEMEFGQSAGGTFANHSHRLCSSRLRAADTVPLSPRRAIMSVRYDAMAFSIGSCFFSSAAS